MIRLADAALLYCDAQFAVVGKVAHEVAELQRGASALGRRCEFQDVRSPHRVRLLHQDVFASGKSVQDHGVAGGRIDG